MGWVALGLTAAAIVALVAVISFTAVEWKDLPQAFMKLNLWVMLGFAVVLPIFGFPISVVYLAAGIRFGPLVGGGVVACVTALHLIGTRWVTRSFLRRPLEKMLERHGKHLPELPPDDRVAAAVFGVLVPGPPYFLRNYLLALADLPLWVYLGVCVPLYTLRSYVVIFFGDWSNDPNARSFWLLAVVYAVKIGACGWVLWRFRNHYRQGRFNHGQPPSAPLIAVPRRLSQSRLGRWLHRRSSGRRTHRPGTAPGGNDRRG